MGAGLNGPTAIVGQRRVLVVEDDALIRGMMVELLEHEGYQVNQAADGLEALGALERSRPDLIVLDLMLPRMSGFQFLEHLHEQVPVLVVSALDRRAAETRVARWLTKPIAADDLIGAVEDLLRSSTRPRVLVIDDERVIRELLVEHLQEDGFAAYSAESIAQARERIAEGVPALILLDLMLPDHSGWDFLRERALDPLLSRIPVVVISAAAQDRLAHAGQLGANALVPKPFDLEALSALVAQFVRS